MAARPVRALHTRDVSRLVDGNDPPALPVPCYTIIDGERATRLDCRRFDRRQVLICLFV
jgi:hypothetical protein